MNIKDIDAQSKVKSYLVDNVFPSAPKKINDDLSVRVRKLIELPEADLQIPGMVLVHNNKSPDLNLYGTLTEDITSAVENAMFYEEYRRIAEENGSPHLSDILAILSFGGGFGFAGHVAYDTPGMIMGGILGLAAGAALAQSIHPINNRKNRENQERFEKNKPKQKVFLGRDALDHSSSLIHTMRTAYAKRMEGSAPTLKLYSAFDEKLTEAYSD